MTQSWCKIASNIDSHPLIRRAGRNGREVFMFALRREAEPNNARHGSVSAAELEPWYLADQLMMPEADAAEGLARCEAAGLLRHDGDRWLLVLDGTLCEWDDAPRSPSTGAQRTAKWRARKSQTSDDVTSPPSLHVTGDDRGDALPSGDERDVTDTASDASDASDDRGEERRSEEKRPDEERERLSPARTHTRAIPPGPAQPAPPPLTPAGESRWHRHKRWWDAMRELHRQLRAEGIEPNTPDLPANFAGTNERNLVACEQQLRGAGYSDADVEAKALHVLAITAAECRRDQHLAWFKPALIWEPDRFNRAVDTTIADVHRARSIGAPRSPRAPPRASPTQVAMDELAKLQELERNGQDHDPR